MPAGIGNHMQGYVQQHHARENRGAGKMSGKGGMIERNRPGVAFIHADFRAQLCLKQSLQRCARQLAGAVARQGINK